MTPLVFKRFTVTFILILLTLSSFFIRLDNFKRSQLRSIDEIVYYRLGQQLKENPSNYNTIPYAQELTRQGRSLPGYFTQPLFKHPPLFSFLIAFFLKIFGNQLVSAEYVSLIFGVLLIPLVYLLGKSIFDKSTGLWAALVLSLDPIQIICSQKVWMETTMTFFTVLSVWLFVLGVKQKNDSFFILSGVASGFAAATKYPGLLATVSIVTFVLIYRRDLFRHKMFVLSLFMPFIVLSPWFYWNYKIYGFSFLIEQKMLHADTPFLRDLPRTFFLVGCFFVLIVALLRLVKKIQLSVLMRKGKSNEFDLRKMRIVFLAILGIFFAVLLHKPLFLSVQLVHLPVTSWGGGLFSTEPPYFYFGRLMEFSLIYFFAFVSFFVRRDDDQHSVAILRISSLAILLFYIAWSNYQSRYILASIPFLIILGVNFLTMIFKYVRQVEKPLARTLLLMIMIWIICFVGLKTFFINALISFPNDLCYF